MKFSSENNWTKQQEIYGEREKKVYSYIIPWVTFFGFIQFQLESKIIDLLIFDKSTRTHVGVHQVFGRRLVLVLYERRANNENKNYKYNKIISFIQVISGHSFSSNYIGIQTNAISKPNQTFSWAIMLDCRCVASISFSCGFPS